MGYLPHILDDWFLVHNQICRHLTQTFFLFYLGSLFLIQQGYLPVSRLKEDHAKIAKILAEKEPFSPDQKALNGFLNLSDYWGMGKGIRAVPEEKGIRLWIYQTEET